MLLLLTLGMAIQPVLGALGEMHAVEHAATTPQGDSDHGHEHAHTHAHAVEAGHAHSGDAPDPDHAIGEHGLMHQGGGASFALPQSTPSLACQMPAEARLPDSAPRRLPGDAPDLPFRPPIA